MSTWRNENSTMNDITFIYALIDPKEKNESHIYVGKSDNPYKRYYEHLKDKYPCHKTNWIQSLLKLGLTPNLQILEQCENIKNIWSEKERENISFYKKCGYNVVNTAEGGEGFSKGHKTNVGKKRHQSEETRKKISESHKGIKPSRETIEKLRLKMIGKKHSEETKNKIRNSHNHSEKCKNAIIESNKHRKSHKGMHYKKRELLCA